MEEKNQDQRVQGRTGRCREVGQGVVSWFNRSTDRQQGTCVDRVEPDAQRVERGDIALLRLEVVVSVAFGASAYGRPHRPMELPW